MFSFSRFGWLEFGEADASRQRMHRRLQLYDNVQSDPGSDSELCDADARLGQPVG